MVAIPQVNPDDAPAADNEAGRGDHAGIADGSPGRRTRS